MAFMFVSATNMANEPKISTNGAKKSLSFELDRTAPKTMVSLEDINGNTIYSEVVTREMGFAKKFDLNNLESGSYFLKVDDDLKEMVYTIDLDSTGVKVASKTESNKPLFKKEQSKVSVSLLNLDLNKVEIQVVDSNNRILFSEEFKNELTIQKTFNFQSAFNDSYTVVVKDGSKTFYEDIVVK